MTFYIGDYVAPKQQYVRQGTPELVDVNHRRTTIGKVIDPLPLNTGTFSYSYFDPTTSTHVTTTIGPVLIYAVRVWDVDIGATAVAFYPATELDSADVSSGIVRAKAYDASDPDVADIAAAERIVRP